MPFCSQCGNQVGPADAYCGRCGARQPPAAAYPPRGAARPNALEAVPGRTWSILCYVPWVGWIASVVVLASDRFRQDRDLRFHAFQGLYLFVGWLIADQVLRPLFWAIPQLHVYQLLEAVLLAMSIFMMVKAAHNEAYALPLFGELAQRSVSGG
ncbi:MAG TPA: hypothetical protein VKX45_04105 [Bryobacteraceae bacterium]|jgi:uncharacterized membrane protein|nr:hypothetical protein [Bryobacteraceae bacterium]